MLAGGLRPAPLQQELGVPPLRLPLGRNGTLLDWWIRTIHSAGRCREIRIVVNNDHDAEVDAFARRAAPLGIPIHLYALNPVPTSDHRPTTRARYEEVYARLTGRGLRVRMSSKARVEANGGCGTLVALGRRRAGSTPEYGKNRGKTVPVS